MMPRLLLSFVVVHIGFSASGATIDFRRVASGLTKPVFVTHAGDARLFIVQQAGIISILVPGATAAATFLDIRSKVLGSAAGDDERGLLGLAFHPAYGTNGRFFVFYTRAGDGALAIAEYHVSANPSVADTTERVILTIPHPTFGNHNGGMIAFGVDGYLYIATGDGGSGNDPGNNAQNIDSLLGKILRIDVNTADPVLYLSPATNPFVNAPGRDEIFAYGLRNPWRFSFDRATANLVVGDVGQGAWEEIDFVVNGGNYGWRVYEGAHCTNIDPAKCTGTGYVNPVIEYDHSAGRCSVTGGYHYQGRRNALNTSWYLFGDYCSGVIFSSSAPASGGYSDEMDTSFLISSFGEDLAGEIYVMEHRGSVYRIVNAARNNFGGEVEPRQFRNDLVWRNSRTGRNTIWYMNGESRLGTAEMQTVTDPNWQIRGSADFDGDGNLDLLWRNQSSGANAVWFMVGNTFRDSQPLQGVADPSWRLAGANDFNGDGWPDLVWRNIFNGYNAIWLMHGLDFVDSRPLPESPDADWDIAGLDDMNDDGWNDLIWHHNGHGGNASWLMNGATFNSSVPIQAAAGPWNLEGTGDMNGDSKPDLIWRNRVTGDNAVWIMNNLSFNGVIYPPAEPDLDFHIVAPR